ncbi:capsule synthesis protein PGA_cap [Geodermatophilus amargosae]|uniref:Capsule synthesis protein PGA_cap n=1 Tax=Geodermatophilus amargosae TaxID=1296565 RepID=A0A1I7DEI9_9ACTN|nr:capsule synthesis protein PGA_cap [Geodermatophilus amargosae]
MPPPRRSSRPGSALLLRLLSTATLWLVAACSADSPVDQAAAQESTPSASAGTEATPEPTPSTTSSAPPESEAGVAISAVGDVIMGATPELPPDDGRHLFDAVADRLFGDIVLGNLDQALTDVATSDKCGGDSSGCFAFRAPPWYAMVLDEAGFTVMNLANNHTHDFGDQGVLDTQAALSAAGLQYTGMPGQITWQDVGSLRVAIVGFAPYGWSQSLLDIPAAVQLVASADEEADLVLVTIHAGAEGVDYTHVRPGSEIFLGENRGDAVAFSHAVIDAGADAVLGAGPHVLRGMEWYRGRLIAYSMGNFLGYETLSNAGPAGIGGIVSLRLTSDGTWDGGSLVGTVMADPGVPQIDPAQQALAMVRVLSSADFGPCGVGISPTGTLGPPTC